MQEAVPLRASPVFPTLTQALVPLRVTPKPAILGSSFYILCHFRTQMETEVFLEVAHSRKPSFHVEAVSLLFPPASCFVGVNTEL